MKNIEETAQELLENRHINEASDMTQDEFEETVLKTVKKIFPNSYVDAGFSSNLGSSFKLTFALAKDKSELSNGIIQNDPAHHIFNIWLDDHKGPNMPMKMTLDRLIGGIKLNPAEGSYMAMDNHKIQFRKVTGDSKKIIDAFDKYFKKLKSELKSVEGNIYNYKLVGKF